MIKGHTKFSVDRNFGSMEAHMKHNIDKLETIFDIGEELKHIEK